MKTQITVPQLGVVEEVVVLEWLKADADTVTEGDALVVIETEKVETEIAAPASGTLNVVVPVSEAAIPVGTILGYISSE